MSECLQVWGKHWGTNYLVQMPWCYRDLPHGDLFHWWAVGLKSDSGPETEQGMITFYRNNHPLASMLSILDVVQWYKN